MLKMMISEVFPGAACEDKGMWQGEVCVVLPPGGGVSPERCVLVSAEQFCAPGGGLGRGLCSSAACTSPRGAPGDVTARPVQASETP